MSVWSVLLFTTLLGYVIAAPLQGHGKPNPPNLPTIPDHQSQKSNLENELPGRVHNGRINTEDLQDRNNNGDIAANKPLQGMDNGGTSSDQTTNELNKYIDVKAVLQTFFKKLKIHPELIQELLEKEEARLMNKLGNVGMNIKPVPYLTPVADIRESPEIIYKTEKTELKKADNFGLYNNDDPRSTSAISKPTSDSDISNKIPSIDVNVEDSIQPGKDEIDIIAELKDQYSEAHPFINSLPYFDQVPNQFPSNIESKTDTSQSSTDNSVHEIQDVETQDEISHQSPAAMADPSIDTSSTKYSIKEIKHVPIEEELVSEVPPSELANKKNLRDAARKVLQNAEKEALKVRQYQQAQQQLRQQIKEEQYQQNILHDKQGLSQEDSSFKPYNYFYYDDNYPEDVKSGTSEESSDSSEPSDESEAQSSENGSEEVSVEGGISEDASENVDENNNVEDKQVSSSD